jgi:hypothetical protein
MRLRGLAEGEAHASTSAKTVVARSTVLEPIVARGIRHGIVSGFVVLLAKSPGKKAAYNWRYSTDQKTWTSIPQTLVSKTGISGLTPATTYYFQCETQTVKGGEGIWGQVVSFLVQ